MSDDWMVSWLRVVDRFATQTKTRDPKTPHRRGKFAQRLIGFNQANGNNNNVSSWGLNTRMPQKLILPTVLDSFQNCLHSGQPRSCRRVHRLTRIPTHMVSCSFTCGSLRTDQGSTARYSRHFSRCTFLQSQQNIEHATSTGARRLTAKSKLSFRCSSVLQSMSKFSHASSLSLTEISRM
jgi:hypothetical protein